MNDRIETVTVGELVVSLFPVLWRDWKKFRPTEPAGPDLHPVRSVTWDDAVSYYEWLGGSWRLPTAGEYDLYRNSVYRFGLWEWTSTAAGDGSRVLRGGSWFLNQGDTRAVDRHYVRPGGRYSYIGFRVVCSSPKPRLTH